MTVYQFPGKSNQTNPFNELLCHALERQHVEVREFGGRQLLKGPKPDIVHAHWPEYWLGLKPWSLSRRRYIKLRAALAIARARGAKIFWTAHNLRPHDSLYPEPEASFYQWWIRSVDGVICLSESAKNQLCATYPRVAEKPLFVIPHGSYLEKVSGIDFESAREELHIDPVRRVMCSLGAIRPYKNIPDLIRAYLQVRDENDLLIIAGKPNSKELQLEIEHARQGAESVRLDFGFLNDRQMEVYAAASNLMVFPYRNILNSGSALYALSVGRAVLAPEVGSLPELQSAVGEEWVRLYSGDFGPSILAHALEASIPNPDSKPDLRAFDWDHIAESTVAAYRQVLQHSV